MYKIRINLFMIQQIKYGILFIILVAVQPFTIQGQVRKYSNDFLSIGVGARGLGMSNTLVASTNDVSSGYWNPAGLTQIKSNIQVGAMHAEYFAGIAKLDHFGVAFKLDSVSCLGANVIRFGIDDIPNTIDLVDNQGNVNYDNITSFSAADYAFLFSYSRKVKVPGLSVGGNAKVVHRKVGDMAHSWGIGLDLGAQYQRKNLKLGLLIRDATTTVNAWTFTLTDRIKEVFALTGNEIPQNSTEITAPRIILGGAYVLNMGKNFTFQPELNIDITTDGQRNVLIPGKPFSIDPHVGFEASFKQIVFLRGGVGNIQKEKNDIGNRQITTIQPNAGLGFRIKNIAIDYALTNIGDQSAGLYTHVFSLKLDIYKSK